MENGELLAARYRILGELGQGGMAVVYRAEDAILKRLVAVKVLREQYAADPAFLGRFQQEARAAAGLSHPNIVSIYDLGEGAGRPYIVMEYLQGAMLKDLIRERGPLPLSQTLQVGIQVASALHYAHRRGIIHRDVKPQNIIVLSPDQPGGSPPFPADEFRVKIMDFGIARALGEASFSTTGEVLGSAHYFSPEQAQGQPVTASTDVYSLGVVLYEMLTGRLPFEGDSQVGIALKHVQETPLSPRELNPRIPPALEALVLRTLEKDPSQRFASAGELEAALRRYSQLGEAQTGVYQPVVVTPTPTPSAGKTQPSTGTSAGAPRRARWLLALLIPLSLAWLGGLAVVATQAFQVLVPVPEPTALPTPSPEPTSTLALVLVPNLVNLDTALARVVVEERGLRYEEISAEFSPLVPAGKIIRQTPTIGTTLAQGGVVSVVVSKGPPKAVLPSVVGLNYADAEAMLQNAGFGVTRQEEWSQQGPKGAVISQVPLGGSQQTLGTVVTVVVSRGWMRSTVPNVVGKAEAEAKQIITEAGYRNAPYVNRQGHDVLPDEVLRQVCIGCVLSTTPAGGTEAELGTEVFMAVRKD